jgi:putative FmdB family regulatory protein
MPLYDYQCPACQHEFEKNVKVANYQDLQPCPKCETESGRIIKGCPGLGDPVRLGLQKPSDAFRDVLRSIADRTPGGSVMRNNSSYI